MQSRMYPGVRSQSRSRDIGRVRSAFNTGHRQLAPAYRQRAKSGHSVDWLRRPSNAVWRDSATADARGASDRILRHFPSDEPLFDQQFIDAEWRA